VQLRVFKVLHRLHSFVSSRLFCNVPFHLVLRKVYVVHFVATELLNEMGTYLRLRWLDMSDVEVLWCCLQTRVIKQILAKSNDVIMLQVFLHSRVLHGETGWRM
jgi:hypothetical protein